MSDTKTTKGSWSRVQDKESYNENWERVFGKRCYKHPTQPLERKDGVAICRKCESDWAEYLSGTGVYEHD